MKNLFYFSSALALVLTLGCGDQKPETPAPEPSAPVAQSEKTAAKPAGAAMTTLDESVSNAAWTGDVEAVKKAVEGGVDVNATDLAGSNTLLNLAIVSGQKEVVSYVIEQGADLEKKNKEGNTPLFNAAFFCRTEVLKLLIDKGADVNAPDQRGATALDVAGAPWSPELEGIYKFVYGILKMELDVEHVKGTRGTIAKLLKENGGKTKSRISQ